MGELYMYIQCADVCSHLGKFMNPQKLELGVSCEERHGNAKL